MADYKESTIAGTKYTRAKRINIENPKDALPYVVFLEEDVFNLGDGQSYTNDSGNLFLNFDDPSMEIPIRNPADWSLTGQTATLGELDVLIASLYWKLASDRDAMNAE